MEKDMFCKNCGKEIENTNKFCNNCGASLSDPEIHHMEDKNMGNNKATKAKITCDKKLKIALFSILGVLGALVVVYGAMLITSPSNNGNYSDVINQQPKVDWNELSDWNKGEFSINNIDGT